MDSRTISVLGCGWLGLPLATALVQAGHNVRGSTTSPEKLERLSAVGIEPHEIRLGEAGKKSDAAFFSCDVLIVTVPPSAAENYPALMRTVRGAAETWGAGWAIMTSSTSVYPNLDRVVTESDAGSRKRLALRRSGADVLAAERVLCSSEQFDTTILRLAGLWGYDRHPARALAGRRGIPGGDAPVNLVHRDDVLGVFEAVLDQDARGTTLNVCADAHPSRRQLYPAVAERLGLEPPTFADGVGKGFKIASSQRLKEELGYRFRYPDPMQAAR